MVGAATAKPREPKHVQTRGTDSKLESDECKRRDGTGSVYLLRNWVHGAFSDSHGGVLVMEFITDNNVAQAYVRLAVV